MRLRSTAAEAEETGLTEAEKGREQNEFNLHSKVESDRLLLDELPAERDGFTSANGRFYTIDNRFDISPRFCMSPRAIPLRNCITSLRSLILRIVMVFMGYFLNSSCLFHYCYFRFFLVFSRFEFSAVTSRREEEGSKSSSRLEEGEDSPTKETGGRGQNTNCPGQ